MVRTMIGNQENWAVKLDQCVSAYNGTLSKQNVLKIL